MDEEFDTAGPRIEGACTMELLAQVRHTGRVLGSYRVALGGEARLKVDVDLGAMVPQETFSGWRFKTQYWLRDIKIRTNMTSSVWVDLHQVVAARDGSIFDGEGAEIPPNEFLRMLETLPADEARAASFRFTVAVGEDGLMKLHMQSLPGPALLISGKPTLRQ